MVKNQSKVSLTPKFLALGVLFCLFLTGCQSIEKSQGILTSEKGVNIENLMPADLAFLFKIGTNDDKQLAQLKELWGYFPNYPTEAVIREFNQGFKEGAKFEEVGLDYEKDILPILSEKTMIVFAAGGDGVPDKMKIFLAMTVADTSKIDFLLNRQVEKGDLVKDQYVGRDYFVEKSSVDQPAYFIRIEDVFMVTNNLDELKASLDAFNSGKSRLRENEVYQEMMLKNKPNLAFVYANLPLTFKFLENGQNDDMEARQLIAAMTQVNVSNKLGGELVVLSAEKDGLRVNLNIAPVKGEKFDDLIGEKVYLFKEIPANDPVLYIESNNLKTAFKQFFDTLASDPANGNSEQEVRDGLKSVGLDYDADLMPMLEKGVAMVVEDTGSIIPAFGFYLDASGNTQAAAKVAGMMDKAVDGIMAEAKAQAGEMEMLLKKEVVEPGKLWKLRLNLDAVLMGAPDVVIKKLSGQKIELYYGLLQNKMMVFALKSDLEQVYGKKSVGDSKEYQFAMKKVGDKSSGVVFLSPDQLMAYVDRLVMLGEEVSGQQIRNAEYYSVKSYFAPVKSVVSSTEKQDEMIESEIFIHIGKSL